MSTLQSKQEALRTASGDNAPGSASSDWRPFGPVELAAISAAHAHAIFVWLIVVAGLSGFRPETVPAVTTSWAIAAASAVGLGMYLSTLAGLAPKPAPPGHSA